ncbi:low molecular weight protein-tyrosine-phosphatase [Jeongeupia chitinilytica]|uniref:protein-tyrosine-phosphatase n=1 Tax=Jeongeupia chitinilytica TaxID=1041641 RepID=A0ABQ3GXS5_9NEIS|nr:low molecular weight protein-tyrosine-phosphatase [Jeongeupia chitinilytica]GHD58854.1 phosphotyrosine protein phosphatase [Jeongeupia chitinilytica]
MNHYSVLMVCTGNICRSPTADGVLRKLVDDAGLAGRVIVDSAGTQDYHVGEAPDRRAQAHAKKRGYDLSPLRARQVSAQDFSRFDLILAMDAGHLRQLERQAPPQHQAKVKLFLDFATAAREREVPDPYYGGADGFEHVLDLVEDGCAGVMEHVRAELARRGL